MMLWLAKCEGMSQFVLGKSARAVPQVEGSGVVEMSDGISSRRKNQVRMPASRSSRAYTYVSC